jgi:hypothetical protein
VQRYENFPNNKQLSPYFFTDFLFFTVSPPFSPLIKEQDEHFMRDFHATHMPQHHTI